MKTVIIGLGSNLGERKENVEAAIQLMGADQSILVEKVSKFIETRAVVKNEQPDYINCVAVIKTTLLPKELLILTQKIEKEMGRRSKGDYGPRTLDIDILFYDNEIVSEDELIIPHPILHERDFVLISLNEIVPDFIHPVLQESISDIYKRVVGY